MGRLGATTFMEDLEILIGSSKPMLDYQAVFLTRFYGPQATTSSTGNGQYRCFIGAGWGSRLFWIESASGRDN